LADNLPVKIRPARQAAGRGGFLPVNCRPGENFSGGVLCRNTGPVTVVSCCCCYMQLEDFAEYTLRDDTTNKSRWRHVKRSGEYLLYTISRLPMGRAWMWNKNTVLQKKTIPQTFCVSFLQVTTSKTFSAKKSGWSNRHQKLVTHALFSRSMPTLPKFYITIRSQFLIKPIDKLQWRSSQKVCTDCKHKS